jgi:hypothetical protein
MYLFGERRFQPEETVSAETLSCEQDISTLNMLEEEERGQGGSDR